MRDLYAGDGPLAKQIPGYAPRPGQLEMAQAVADAMAGQRTLVVEAGTGTGKTFAYLIPALLSGRRTVISTGTLTLQDQLFHRDLPLVRAALKVSSRVTLLKGRANYLCHHRLKLAAAQGTEQVQTLAELRDWARRSDHGEVQSFAGLSEKDPLLPAVTSTAENCLGSRCDDFDKCFVAKARRNAQVADIVVVNHHLLFADFVLKEEGFGQILPGAETVIVDEAHQLPEIASRFFGARVSTRQMLDLARDCDAEATAVGDLPVLRKAATELAAGVSDLERCFAARPGRERLDQFLEAGGAVRPLQALQDRLYELQQELSGPAERAPEFAACKLRAQTVLERLDGMLNQRSEKHVTWVESAGRGGRMHSTPVRVDEDFNRMRSTQDSAWILTSATLAVGGDFSHFCDTLGLDDAETLSVPSPFNYAEQARLYLPETQADPNTPGYADAVADAVLPLVEASGGGAFILCTSHRALRQISERCRARLKVPVYVQGERARADLLDAFSRDGNAVLVGTASFWEGVDVRGQALRIVAIDRIPFTAPGDPVFEARLQALREAGQEPFRSYQLPLAIMGLRQGAGRLIRDPQDRGLLVLCDPRLRSKGYGKKILASLPNLPRVDGAAEAEAWIRQIAEAA